MIPEITRGLANVGKNRPFPFAFVDVRAPDHFGLNGGSPRSVVAAGNATLGYEEKAFFGNPGGFPKETPAVTPIYRVSELNGRQREKKSRVVTMVPIAPYTYDSVMTVATGRPQPSLAELAAHGEQRTETTMVKDLTAEAAIVYQASLNAGLQTAAQYRSSEPETGYPFIFQNHFQTITNEDFPTSRSVALVHAHIGRYRSTELIPREGPDFPAVEVEQDALTLDRTTWMAIGMQRGLDYGFSEFGYPGEDYSRVIVSPRIDPPVGVEIRYRDITVDSLTEPNNIKLMATVSRLLLSSYIAGLIVIDANLPSHFEHKSSGVIFERLPVPGFREITYVHDRTDEIRTAIAPALIQSPNGAPNLAGIKGRRGSKYTLTEERQAQATLFAQQAGENIDETVARLRLAA